MTTAISQLVSEKSEDLVIDNKANCYVLDSRIMEDIQNNYAKRTNLTPGIYVIRIRSGSFDYISEDEQIGEPLVMLWIYGGKFKNLKTGKKVPASWSTLNGYDDTVTLAVFEDLTLAAFFFDTYKNDNQGELTVSVVKVGELEDISV